MAVMQMKPYERENPSIIEFQELRWTTNETSGPK
jgi:hypothetical protein